MITMDSEPRQIAILLPLTSQFTRGLLNGICAYAQTAPRWYLRLAAVAPASIDTLRRTRPDGIITMGPTDFIRALMELDVPLVNCGSNAPIPEVPTVRVDNAAIGALAASYFQDRGCEHFAYCGRDEFSPLIARGNAFEQAVNDMGHPCHRFPNWPATPAGGISNWLTPEDATRVQQWLLELPRPVAIFCSDDLVAVQMVAACTQAGLRVPDDAAVLGVDNDEVVCQLASPPVSSVSLPHMEIGYQGAALLHQLLNPARAAGDRHERIFPPTEVVTRASTDVVAAKDPDVAAALRFIRDHSGEPIHVPDVVSATRVSRRALEAKFRRALRRTIFSEIRSAHIRQARRLLRDTDWTMDHVALASGFNSRDRLTAVFSEQTGQTPHQYRLQFVQVGAGRRP